MCIKNGVVFYTIYCRTSLQIWKQLGEKLLSLDVHATGSHVSSSSLLSTLPRWKRKLLAFATNIGLSESAHPCRLTWFYTVCRTTSNSHLVIFKLIMDSFKNVREYVLLKDILEGKGQRSIAFFNSF